MGEDTFKSGWLKRQPNFHDIPCQDITLTGQNYSTENVLADSTRLPRVPFCPTVRLRPPNQVIKGQIPCSGAVMRIPLDGGALRPAGLYDALPALSPAGIKSRRVAISPGSCSGYR
ncbi:hypothetical protein [Nibrella viscosa]|uniref:hypothetical protein n=1 Tax=Nibrella viscosa TaxID=1084524 RepID=UPI0031EB5A6C